MLRSSWFKGTRDLAGPGLVLQALAIAIVAAYYLCPPWRQALQHLVALRTQWGWGFSVISTSICGGIIPFLYLTTHSRTRAANPLSHFWFHSLFWGYKGFEVDAFYHLQAFMFGRDPSFHTVLRKVLVDEFVYTPLLSVPVMLILYRWKDLHFKATVFFQSDWKSYLAESYPRSMISCWMIWIPAVAAIYSLPFPLQIPLFNVELCFWTLLFSALTQRPARSP